MLELWQAEWCPYSHRVRMHLTERGVDVVLHQVEPDRDARDRMAGATGGERGIPTLVAEDGEAVHGADEIVAWVDERFPADEELVRAHRVKRRAEREHWLEAWSR